MSRSLALVALIACLASCGLAFCTDCRFGCCGDRCAIPWGGPCLNGEQRTPVKKAESAPVVADACNEFCKFGCCGDRCAVAWGPCLNGEERTPAKKQTEFSCPTTCKYGCCAPNECFHPWMGPCDSKARLPSAAGTVRGGEGVCPAMCENGCCEGTDVCYIPWSSQCRPAKIPGIPSSNAKP